NPGGCDSATILMEANPNYLNAKSTISSWLFSTDHKRIGILYLLSITFFFAIGGMAATWLRVELATPEGDVLSSNEYTSMFTIPGVVMVWFFLVPSMPHVFGNFHVPMMIGARDPAFPQLSLMGWCVYMLGGLFTLCVIIKGG